MSVSSASMTFTFDTSEAEEYFTKMALRMVAYEPVFEKLKVLVRAGNATNFMSQGGLYGGWAPLAPYTLVNREEHGFPPAPMMYRTGTLIDSLVSLDGPPNVIGPESATFGTDVSYAEFHQYGTHKMPARQLMPDLMELGPFAARLVRNHIVPDGNGSST